MNLLIACGNIKDELSVILDIVNIEMDVVWMDSRLHSKPDNLHDALQNEIDSSIGYDNILLGFGNCGNCLSGIVATTSTLVMPHKKDCIDILLHRDLNLESKRKKTYFLTRYWIENEQGLKSEYEAYKKKYGYTKSRMIMRRMFKNYETLAFIDEDTSSYEEYNEVLRYLAEELELKVMVEKGDYEIFEKLMSGNWDDDFRIVKKGMIISQRDLI